MSSFAEYLGVGLCVVCAIQSMTDVRPTVIDFIIHVVLWPIVVALALNAEDPEPMRPWEVAYVAGVWPAPVIIGLARLLGLTD